MNKKYTTAGLILLLIICAFPFVTAPIALLAGIIYSVSIGNPIIEKTSKWTHKLLQFSVVGLGFGMNATVALESGRKGLLYTAAGIVFAFGLGYILSRIIKVEKKTSFLISAGTAICGGSAIAAVAPIIEAKSEETSVSLGVVFILNSVALLIFPIIGHYLNLSQEQFGLWSAIAIHDTSSVVGASSQYGKEALAIATDCKTNKSSLDNTSILGIWISIQIQRKENKNTLFYFCIYIGDALQHISAFYERRFSYSICNLKTRFSRNVISYWLKSFAKHFENCRRAPLYYGYRFMDNCSNSYFICSIKSKIIISRRS